ncbi:MAG: SAM-dependent methyltransferase [Acidimicrobiales bacterium]
MDPIATTALGVARVRAIESARPDRIFEDRLAAHFVAALPALPPVPTNPAPEMVALARYLVIRTRFFDEMLLDAANSCRQIVVLGAGLDARAFRFRWPEGTRLFELDQPEMLSWKQQVLDGVGVEPTCERIVVPADLRTDWPIQLAASGHDASEPTAWLAEGLLLYLTTSVVECILEDVALRSAVGSRFGLTTRRVGAMAPTTALDELWISSTPDDPETWLRGHGWEPTFHRPGVLASRYGRNEWSHLEGSGLVDARRLPTE